MDSQNTCSEIEVGVIIVAASYQQNTHFWPTYKSALAGIQHDLIVVHIGGQHVPGDIKNFSGDVIYEDKKDLPHKAFGAYHKYGLQYLDQYKYLAFISDDVLIRRDNWLSHAISTLKQHPKIGFVGTQILNGSHGKYPHKSHVRAPIWFARSSALKQIEWNFVSDHGGEMSVADQFVDAGFMGVQAGSKFDLAYDSLQKDHIVQLLEKRYYPDKNLKERFSEEDISAHTKYFYDALIHFDTDYVNQMSVISPFQHVGCRNIISQVEPFDRLLYDKGLNIARACGVLQECRFNVNLLRSDNGH